MVTRLDPTSGSSLADHDRRLKLRGNGVPLLLGEGRLHLASPRPSRVRLRAPKSLASEWWVVKQVQREVPGGLRSRFLQAFCGANDREFQASRLKACAHAPQPNPSQKRLTNTGPLRRPKDLHRLCSKLLRSCHLEVIGLLARLFRISNTPGILGHRA